MSENNFDVELNYTHSQNRFDIMGNFEQHKFTGAKPKIRRKGDQK